MKNLLQQPSLSHGFRALLLLATAIGSSNAQVVSDFEVDADGWIVADLPLSLGNPPIVINTFPVTYSSAGGNPGGHISRADPTALWFHFSAPAKFLGDKSAYYGGRIQYDMSTTAVDMFMYPAVILVGAGKALYYNAVWPQTSFTPYDIPLLPTGWRVGSYTEGDEPTEEEMREVLADLEALYIDGDWSSIDEVTKLDNVRLLLPVSSGSVMGINYDRATQQVEVLFKPDSDGFFQLESNPDLNPDPAEWTAEGEPVSGSMGVPFLFETTTDGEPRMFFRVRGM